VERYAALAAALEDRGYRVAIVGDRNDEWVRPAFASTKVVDVVGRLDLPQTLRLLSDARVVVTHDTGPLHFARLVRARIVALFGPTAPRQMIGNPDGVTVLWGGEHLPCRPCYDGKEFPPCALNLCMSEIPMESVLAATLAWIINGTSLPTA
jgi:heptosyltransferase-2